MTEMSAAEAATVARFEAAEPAPESWDGGLRSALAIELGHHTDWMFGYPDYDAADDVLALPEVAALRADAEESEKRLDALIQVRRERDALRAEVAALRAKAAAADRVRELHRRDDLLGWCDHCGGLADGGQGSEHPCPTIHALDGTAREDRGRC